VSAQFDPASYATPEKRARVYELLDIAFPGLGASIPRMEPLGAAWHENSTPFVLWEGNQPVAHVGVLEIELSSGDDTFRVPGLHAVCTHPEHRGKGLARQLMESALVHCDERFDTAVLFADVPAMYAKFGFRTLDQRAFRIAVQPVDTHDGFRPVTPERDLVALHAILAEREPVSRVLGCVRTEYMFFCDLLIAGLGFEHIHYAEDLDAYVVGRVQGETLFLLDVVARRMPSLRALLEHLDRPIREVRFGFVPDQLEVGATVVTTSLADDIFMVRGPWPGPPAPFRFPFMAHC